MSFSILKPITCGEGGAILCIDKAVVDEIRITREYGMMRLEYGKKTFVQKGGNFKLTEFQAVILLSQFQRIDQILSHRKWLREAYDKILSNLNGVSLSPKDIKRTNSAFIIIDVKETGFSSEDGARGMWKNGVEVESYLPLHKEPYFKEFVDTSNSNLSNADSFSKRLIALPSHIGITEKDVKLIGKRLVKVFEELSYK